MAKKPAMKKSASGKRRFEGGGSTATDILRDALATRPSSSGGNLVPRSSKTSLDAPKGRSVAKRGSTSVAKPGRPTIDVDARTRPGEKFAGQGSGIKTAPKALQGPKLDLPSAEDMSGRGQRGSNISRAAALALGAGTGLATQKGIQSLATGPNAGMDTTGTIAALNRSDKGNQRVVMKGDLPVGVAPKRASTGFTDAADVGPPRPLGPTGKPAPKPMARKPRATADDDAFLNDLRASAAKMKEATSDAARETGRMKGAMEDFQFAADDAAEGYKKGGRVGGRGDGKAMRGRTKGRFI